MGSRSGSKCIEEVALRARMSSKSLQIRSISAALCLAAFAASSIGWATVIGRSEAAQSLTAARISDLPAAKRGAWLAYLERSEQQEKLDRAALASERQG